MNTHIYTGMSGLLFQPKSSLVSHLVLIPLTLAKELLYLDSH